MVEGLGIRTLTQKSNSLLIRAKETQLKMVNVTAANNDTRAPTRLSPPLPAPYRTSEPPPTTPTRLTACSHPSRPHPPPRTMPQISATTNDARVPSPLPLPAPPQHPPHATRAHTHIARPRHTNSRGRIMGKGACAGKHAPTHSRHSRSVVSADARANTQRTQPPVSPSL